jgi:hypothetical protein
MKRYIVRKPLPSNGIGFDIRHNMKRRCRNYHKGFRLPLRIEFETYIIMLYMPPSVCSDSQAEHSSLAGPFLFIFSRFLEN